MNWGKTTFVIKGPFQLWNFSLEPEGRITHSPILVLLQRGLIGEVPSGPRDLFVLRCQAREAFIFSNNSQQQLPPSQCYGSSSPSSGSLEESYPHGLATFSLSSSLALKSVKMSCLVSSSFRYCVYDTKQIKQRCLRTGSLPGSIGEVDTCWLE